MTTNIEQEWQLLLQKLHQTFGKTPDLNGILFLIGVQELGQGKRNFSKEEKQDLIHIGMCKIFEGEYYEFESIDAEGWPHFKELKPMPQMFIKMQESTLKQKIVAYFQKYIFE